MLKAPAFFALAFAFSFFIAVFSSSALMILASPSETSLRVLEIENPSNLPVEFFDSLRSDDDFIFYEFKLNSKEPLLLRKLTVLEEGTGNRKEFAISLTESGSAVIKLFEDSPVGYNAAKIEGDYSLLTSETFRHEYAAQKDVLFVELTDRYFLSAVYEFEEGPIKVKYFFSDKETRAFWLFFWLIPISVSAVLTALYVIAVHFRQNKTAKNL